ncbi:hypothetical protein ACIOBL_19545 [Paenibacillus taichungensis]|uniref:hypothetical protein n=1 Tax=Paenibacillus taichungensis TaxID=484184 RepID=UPI00381F5AAD
MNEPKTPNLGLNKIDRSSPSTTYFDLDKYLDQNWEKVDEGVGKMEEKAEETAAQVSSIQERLDTEKRRSVTLEPGLQIISAERASAFKLEGLKGRTLVNLLGRDGGCEDLSKIGVHQSTLTLDSANKVQGSNGLKIAINTGTSGIGFFTASLKAGKSYVAIAEVKNGNGTSVYINLAGVGAKGNPVTDTTKFNVTWTRYTPPSDMTLNVDVGVVGTAVGQFGYADAVRLYELSAVEYAALASMTSEQIAAKYPYVEGIQPVRNPYGLRYGVNLLPPFYEWTKTGHLSNSVGQYEAVGTLLAAAISTDAYASYEFGVLPNQDYTISNPAESTGFLRLTSYDIARSRRQAVFIKPGESKVITTRAEVVRMEVVLSGVTSYTGEYYTSDWTWQAGTTRTFKNPMLNVGSVGKPFKPRKDAMIALQTDLYADPGTGANADEVIERDGQYFKLAMWRMVTLDGALVYRSIQNKTDYKIVGCKMPEAAPFFNKLFVYKYNGNLLTKTSTMVGPDNAYFLTNDLTDFNVSIANSDSGWGESYTPTADEIKAYFMGWVIFDGSAGTGSGNSPDVPTSNVYKGTGSKWWVRRSDGVSRSWSDATNILPTTQAPNWTPYQLLYQLATPVVEPTTSEGQLTLIEGSNQVEVGTGIVLRENVKPYTYTININNINDNSPESAGNLKNKTNRLLTIYAEGLQDFRWSKLSNIANANGGGVAQYIGTLDKSKSYSVTYLMLETYPVATFVGSVADSEKALLTDLVKDVQHGATSLSLLERSLKDSLRTLIQIQNKRDVWGPIE